MNHILQVFEHTFGRHFRAIPSATLLQTEWLVETGLVLRGEMYWPGFELSQIDMETFADLKRFFAAEAGNEDI